MWFRWYDWLNPIKVVKYKLYPYLTDKVWSVHDRISNKVEEELKKQYGK